MKNESMQKKEERIKHVLSHLNGGYDLPILIKNVEDNAPHAASCALRLASHASASAVASWFAGNDLKMFQHWCYTAAKCEMLALQLEQSAYYLSYYYSFFLAIASNNAALIEEFLAFFPTLADEKRRNKPATEEFFFEQISHAWRGNWEELKNNSSAVISLAQKNPTQKLHENEFLFLNALSRGDVDGMKSALNALVDGKELRRFSKYESGYTADLISSTAIICNKIAWRHGFKLNIGSQYIPEQWLPFNEAFHEKSYTFLE